MNLEHIVLRLFGNDIMDMVLILFLIWMYKEFRSHEVIKKQITDKKIEKALESYGLLQINIIQYLDGNENSHFLKGSFANTFPYLSIKLMKQSIEWLYEEDIQLLENIKSELEEEIARLKTYQINKITYNPSDDVFEKIKFFVEDGNIKTFITPFIYTAFSFLGVILLMAFVSTVQNSEGIVEIIWIYALLATGFACLFLFLQIFNLIIQNKFESNLENYIVVFVLFSIMLIIFVITPFHSYINLIPVLLYILFWHKKVIRRG